MVPTVEAIAATYLEQADGDAGRALREVIADALADLCEAERRTRQVERLVSKGYARGRSWEPAGSGRLGRSEADAGGRSNPPPARSDL
jgi:hypothetical protein